jgi:hypothetical protein
MALWIKSPVRKRNETRKGEYRVIKHYLRLQNEISGVRVLVCFAKSQFVKEYRQGLRKRITLLQKLPLTIYYGVWLQHAAVCFVHKSKQQTVPTDILKIGKQLCGRLMIFEGIYWNMINMPALCCHQVRSGDDTKVHLSEVGFFTG